VFGFVLIASSLYGQVLALMVPSRFEIISSGDWAMISD